MELSRIKSLEHNNIADQDSDSLYVTNQPSIVDSARRYYNQYPTIVNNIPKEKNHYNNTPEDFAKIDNNLAASQRAIGESSNLAQIALSYSYNFDDQMIYDDVCILSVLAQCAIDNAKRKFDIDIMEEILLIKQSMDISRRGYPQFWSIIRPDFNKKKIQQSLKCPMNYIYKIELPSYQPIESNIPIGNFFIKHELKEDHRVSRKVEKLIEKYFIKFYINNTLDSDTTQMMYLMKQKEFDNLISDIHQVYLSKNYLGLMSWLINRSFLIGAGIRGRKDVSQSKTQKNRAILLKTLFTVNPNAFLQCFIKKLPMD